MAKHQVEVLNKPVKDVPPSDMIYFGCKKCVARVGVPRLVMYSLLTGNPEKLKLIGIEVWSECRGA